MRAMSRDNAEKLRAFTGTWTTADDALNLSADMSLLDPNVIYEDNVLPDHTREAYRGHEGVLRAIWTWLEPYERFRIDLEQIIGTGDRLVSIHRFEGKARSSGIETEIRYAYLWVFRDGRIIRFVAFRHPEQALEAAGLSE